MVGVDPSDRESMVISVLDMQQTLGRIAGQPVHAAVYSDVGDAFTPGFHDFKLHAGAGAELRAEVVLGWILPTDLRLGCARGLENSPLAIVDCYAALGGVF